MLTERQNQYLDYLIEPASKSFQEINRLFLLTLKMKQNE